MLTQCGGSISDELAGRIGFLVERLHLARSLGEPLVFVAAGEPEIEIAEGEEVGDWRDCLREFG
jgi:hypothetical protein